MSLLLTRLLIGKLSEGWQLIQKSYFRSKLSADYDSRLNPAASSALADLKRYFNKKSLIHSIRNDYAFHFSPDKLDEALQSVEDDDLLIFLGSSGQASNSLHYHAEVLATAAMIDSTGLSDPERGFDRIIKEAVSVTGLFLSFLDGAMSLFLDDHASQVLKSQAEQLRVRGLESFDHIETPWFTRAPKKR